MIPKPIDYFNSYFCYSTFSCQSDHLICEECIRHVEDLSCPVCREEFGGKTPNRNFLAEKIIHALNILRTDPSKTAAPVKKKIDVEKVVPEPGSGLTEPGLEGTGLVSTGLVGSGLLGTGLAGSGLAGPGLAEPGLVENGFLGAELAENGFTGAGLAEPGLNENRLIDVGLTVPVEFPDEPNTFEQNSEIQIEENKIETEAETEVAIESNSEIGNPDTESQIISDEISDHAHIELPEEDNE